MHISSETAQFLLLDIDLLYMSWASFLVMWSCYLDHTEALKCMCFWLWHHCIFLIINHDIAIPLREPIINKNTWRFRFAPTQHECNKPPK